MRPYAFALVLVALLPLTAVPVVARGDDDGHRVRRLDQILPQVRRSHPGTFYDAEGPFEAHDGRPHYRLKWLTPDGRVVWLDVDAETGAVLGEVRVYGAPGAPRPQSERRYRPNGNWRQDKDRPHDRDDRDDDRGHDRPHGQ